MPGIPPPGKPRTTKSRAQRIDRQYFLRTFGMQRWRWILSGAAIALGLLWLGFHSAAQDSTVYTAGALTPAHALLNRKCTVCHTGGGFTAKVSDSSCTACHSGAMHQASQTFTPHCIDCHRQHTGGTLQEISDRQCTTCHASLQTKSGDLEVAAHISSFTTDHPGFSTETGAVQDPGTIPFSHAVHMKKGLRSIAGDATLVCSDCHQAGHTVNYYDHCSKCHPLTFDPRFSEPAPHKDPAVVHEFLAQKFTAWIAAHPEELRGAPSTPRIPALASAPPPHTPAAWVQAQVDQAEKLLRVKTCKECHELPPADHGIPAIAKAQIKTRWLQHADFDHSAHQMLDCESCHKDARKSEKTSDVLIPGISVCRDCHISGRQDAARANCAECHLYHDPAKRKPVQGRFTLDQVSVH